MRIANLRLARRSAGFRGSNLQGKAHRLGLVGPQWRWEKQPFDGPARVHRAHRWGDALGGAARLLIPNPDHQLLFPTMMEELCFAANQQGKTSSKASLRLGGGRVGWPDRGGCFRDLEVRVQAVSCST